MNAITQIETANATPVLGAQSLQERWSRVKKRLQAEVGDDLFSSWFARMDLDEVAGDTARLSVPTPFLKSWIKSHYTDRVLSCWKAELASVRHVDFTVRSVVRCRTAKNPDPEACGKIERSVLHVATPQAAVCSNQNLPAQTAHEALGGSPLDPRFTLKHFVVGRSNTLAHAAAKQVATAYRGEQVLFNPLYVHAGVGLGKSHLLQAIAWTGNAEEGGRKVLYLTAEKFMYGFVAALKAHTTMAFKEALRGIDVLIIDDAQYLSGKMTLTEFGHLLNSLIDSGRQVVIGADRPPADLEIDERIRSRLAGGLVIEIGPQEKELRTDILKSKIAAAQTHNPQFAVSDLVLSYIAETLSQGGRDLEGALNRLVVHHKLTGFPVTMDMAERAVRDHIRPGEPKRVKIEDIQRVVARQYNVSRADLLSSRRTANVVRPRQIAMYLAKTLTLRSLPEIGRRFGGRDHTTVLHAVRKIESLVELDEVIAEEVELLKRLLQE